MRLALRALPPSDLINLRRFISGAREPPAASLPPSCASAPALISRLSPRLPARGRARGQPAPFHFRPQSEKSDHPLRGRRLRSVEELLLSQEIVVIAAE